MTDKKPTTFEDWWKEYDPNEVRTLTWAIEDAWNACQAANDAELTRLRIENERLKKELAILRAAVVTLREALQRFSNYAKHFPDHSWDFETVLMEVTNAPNITLGDCRKAAAALASTTHLTGGT